MLRTTDDIINAWATNGYAGPDMTDSEMAQMESEADFALDALSFNDVKTMENAYRV